MSTKEEWAKRVAALKVQVSTARAAVEEARDEAMQQDDLDSNISDGLDNAMDALNGAESIMDELDAELTPQSEEGEAEEGEADDE